MTTETVEPAANNSGGGRHTRQKEYRRADAIIFLETADKLKISHTELSHQLGYTEKAFRAWVNSGKMPYVVALACEALVKRFRGSDGKSNSVTLLVRIDGDRVVEARGVAAVNTAKFGDQEYLLIPKR